MAKKILVIATSVAEYAQTGYRTGLWLGELTHFWDVAEAAGIAVDIASPLGGFVPMDPESLTQEVLADLGTGKRYKDRTFMNLLTASKKISEVSVDDYDAIYLTGGHGTMFDFPNTNELARLIAEFARDNKVVSAVCHGPTGLLNVRLDNGGYLINGKKVTGFTWAEEVLAQRDTAVPFSLEDEMLRRQAVYSKAKNPFEPYVVEDGKLITGQNPASARGVAEAVIRQLTAG
ncbi:type 1 glutamine amidotransferase domain-containing protein [Noviherbaspirillum saxi]|uniref:Type 1 glutamine amidotransferase domain-containing protein n=1 Tax=Noviherbaspirillum saxi TaxID=2320863 RepID=A0A3A3FGN7_9BURK|nr:type 1 glutamine amidotransferase domain-containing protein [Noviherbaspirillum saxi]RJF92340.1 type 1 glutamine amidotransferase domain-containing protein [Noviherbaspirillum saxi]